MSPESAIEVMSYEYPAGADPNPPSWSAIAFATPEPAPETPPHQAAPDPQEQTLPTSQEIQEELQRRFEAGRQLGLSEGRKAEREAHDAALRAMEDQYRLHLASLVERFNAARDRHLEEIEHEVVDLALAISARILRREAQMDPLLLTGSVRVALGQLSLGAKARLLVPESELSLWREAIAHIPNLSLKPEVVAGERLRPGDCQIETELGSVDLGIRAQLGEIERGFFDRPMQAETPGRRHPAVEPHHTRQAAE